MPSGCSAPEEPADQLAASAQETFSSLTCGAGVSPVADIQRWFPCGTLILPIRSGDSETDSAIQHAVTLWNTALASAPGTSKVPRFAQVDSASVTPENAWRALPVRRFGEQGPWCDITNMGNPSERAILFFNDPIGTGKCPTNVGELPDVAVHSLGHVLGLLSDMHKVGREHPGVSDHCSINLPLDGSVNPGICQHELDALYLAYEVWPGTLPIDPEQFWGRHIISGLTIGPPNVPIEQDETYDFVPAGPFFRYAGTPPSVSSLVLDWATTDNRVGFVADGTNRFVAVGVGSATVTARPSSAGLPSGVIRSVFLTNSGPSATVSVTAPTAGPGYRVTDIVGPGTPIQESGSFAFTASVFNGGTAGNLRTSWAIVRSDAPADTVTTSAVGATASIPVSPGSYTLRLVVTPHDLQSQRTGLSYIEDFTVCTEGAGSLHGGAGTNAVEGCGGPPPLY